MPTSNAPGPETPSPGTWALPLTTTAFAPPTTPRTASSAPAAPPPPRPNVPMVFIYGGTIPPGTFQGRDVTIQDVFEGVGAYAAGKMTLEELRELECSACPTEGSCAGMYTANTMASAIEAIGLSLPGSASIPAVGARMEALCRRSGEGVLQLVEKGITARALLPPDPFHHPNLVV